MRHMLKCGYSFGGRGCMRKGLGIVRWEWAGVNVVVEVSLIGGSI